MFSAEGSCVDTSIVNGRIVRRSKEFLDIDEEEIRAKANEAFQGALNRMVVPDQYKYLSR